MSGSTIAVARGGADVGHALSPFHGMGGSELSEMLAGARMHGAGAVVGPMNSLGLGVQIELENAGNHDHGLRAVAALEHGKFQGFGAVDEQATAEALLILGDPVAVAVLADAEQPRQRRRGSRRGRFGLAHDTFPSS